MNAFQQWQLLMCYLVCNCCSYVSLIPESPTHYKDILATLMRVKTIKYTCVVLERTVRLGWTQPTTLRKIQENMHP
jgi:hypothetical protein